MRLLRESVIVLALGLALSSAAAPGETSFKVRRGQYPWHVWNSPVYKQNFTWPQFRKEVAELNGLPNTDKAFRHLKRGTELKIPNLPGAGASELDIQKAKVDQRELDQLEFNAVRQSWESEKKRLQDALDRSYTTIYRNLWFWLGIAGALVLGAGLMYYLGPRLASEPDSSLVVALRQERSSLQNTLRDRDEEISQVRAELQELRRESDARDHFIGKYAELFDLPPDIGSFKGKHNRIYLLRTEPLEGEPAVQVWNGQKYVVVKRKNLNRWFDEHKTNAEVMEYYGIYPDEQVTRRMRSGTNG